MSSNLSSFVAGLSQAAQKLPEEVAEVVLQTTALQVLSGVVLKTPVDTGRARGNWVVTSGRTTERALKRTDRSGRKTLAAGQRVIERADIDNTLWIQNNLPYAAVLDQGGFVPKDPGPSSDKRAGREGKVLVRDGYSVQAPQGMVARTLQEVGQQFT